MATRLLVLPAVMVGLFVATGLSARDDKPQSDDKSKAPAGRPKNDAELLVGKWKNVTPGETLQHEREYTRDGKVIDRTNDKLNGPQMGSSTYRLTGATLVFGTAPRQIDRNEIRQVETILESVNDTEMVTTTIVKKRMSMKFAREIAELRDIPVEPLLAEVREEKFKNVYRRVADR